MTALLVLMVTVAAVIGLIIADFVGLLSHYRREQPDSTTSLTQLWNMMRAHDLRNVELNRLDISSDGQIMACSVEICLEAEGKTKRIAAPYCRYSENEPGGQPVMKAIERLELNPHNASAWRIMIRVHA